MVILVVPHNLASSQDISQIFQASGAGKVVVDTAGGRTEDMLSFEACDARVGFCTGYVLAVEVVGRIAGTAGVASGTRPFGWSSRWEN